MGKNIQIKKLIENFYLNSLSDDEMSLLLNYLKDKEPQHEILSYYQELWNRTSEDNNFIDSERIYKKIVSKVSVPGVNLRSAPESSKKKGFRVYFITFMRYAAVFILAFGLFWLTQLLSSNKKTTPQRAVTTQITRVEVPYGSKSRVVFPDGSVVTLNSGSILKYSDSDFDSLSRSVFITGEGFFNITKDPSRPFYVNTPGIKLKVLGTTFNVKAYPEDNIEEATLVSGKIEIYASSDKTESGKTIVLKPNQSAVFVKSGNNFHSLNNIDQSDPKITHVKLKTVNLQSSSKTEQIISWHDSKLVFDNESFSNIVTIIERWYDVKILVNYPELLSVRFTGKFDKETLEQVLNALKTINPFNYTIKQNQVTISKD